MRCALACCLPLVIAVGLPSQTTHLVGPGGLPQIRDALAIAAPGDIIHVQPGTYAHFVANVGVTIRALTPGTVDVAFDFSFVPPACANDPFCATASGPTHLQPPAGQLLHITGVRFAGNTYNGPITTHRHRVVVSSGRVTLDRCEVRATDTVPLMSSATVHLQDSLVQAQVSGSASPSHGYAAIYAISSHITATGCSFHGGSPTGVGVGIFAGEAVILQSSMLHGSHLLMTGGSGTLASIGAPALWTDGGSPVWISDSTLTAGTGECAIEGATNTTRFDRCTLTSNAVGCAPGTTSPFLLGVERPNPLQPGSTFDLRYRTEPNGFVAVFASGELGTVGLGPWLQQPSWLGANGSFVAAVVGADATGLAIASWPIPAGPFNDLTLWFQGVSGFTLPLQASVPAGGVVR